jgi:SAM-dependent methyltransferase
MKSREDGPRKEEKRYWDSVRKSGKRLDLKYSRGLPDDSSDFVLNVFAEFERDVAMFCFKAARGRILDAGCGSGDILIRALNIPTTDSATYVGIDFSTLMLKLAVSRTKDVSNVSFILADIGKLPLREESFDRVICSGVRPASLDDVKDSLKEFHRVLKPNGVLIKDFINPFSHTVLIGKIAKLLDSPDYYMSPSSYREQFETAGFKVIDYRGFDYRPIQGNVLFQAPKWLRILLNPGSVHERFTRLIETKVVSAFPSLSFLGHRVYVKCARQ